MENDDRYPLMFFLGTTVAAVILGTSFGWLVSWEKGALFSAGLYPFGASAAGLYFWPLTIAAITLSTALVFIYGNLEFLHHHRWKIILFGVTLAPFFSGVNLGPLDPSDPAFLLSFLAVVILLCVERRQVRLEPFVFCSSMLIIIFAFTSIFGGRVSTIVQLHTIITKVLLVFIVVNLVRNITDINRFAKAFLLISALTAAVAVGSEAVFLTTGVPLTFDDAEGFHYKHTPIGQMLRATGFMSSTQGLAHVMMIASAMTLSVPLRLSFVTRTGLLALFALGCLSTFSAGSYLAMASIYIAAPFVLFGRHWIPILAGYFGVGVILFVTGAARALLEEVLIPLGLRNFMERMEFIRRGLRGAENWPWTGNGIGNIGRHLETSIHNAYVQSAVDIGVIGGTAFTSILIYLVARNWRIAQSAKIPQSAAWGRTMVLVVGGISIHLLFEPFFNNTITWLVIGFATANIVVFTNVISIGTGLVSNDFKRELDLSLSGYLSTLYRMRFVILLVTLSSGVFAFYFSKTLEPRYEAVAQFYIPETVMRSGRAESELPVAPVPSGNRDGVTAAVSLLRTNELRRRVNALAPEKPFSELDLDVDPVVERSSMVHVFVRDADPNVAAKVANSYFDAFVQFVDEQQSTQQSVALERTVLRLRELDDEIATLAQSDRDRMERLLSLRETLTSTQQNLEKQALGTSNAAIMASPAQAPVGPVFPILPLNVIVSLIAGLIMGIIYSVLLDHIRMSRRRRRYVKLQREAVVKNILADVDNLSHSGFGNG